MFCRNCGKEIHDSALVCPNCGVPTDNMQKQVQVPVAQQKNTFAIIGFIFSFFGSLLGLIFSIMGLSNSKKPEYAGDGKALSIAGIIISCISTVVYMILYIVISVAYYLWVIFDNKKAGLKPAFFILFYYRNFCAL